MKSGLMLLLLVTLSTPVLSKPNANTSECLQIYRTYLNDYGASKFIPPEEMRSFIYHCMPADYLDNPEYDATQENQDAIHFNEDNGKVITVKT